MGTDTPQRREKLVKRRKHVGLTHEMLGELIGVTAQTISAWERGLRNPLLKHRQALAKALGISLHDMDKLMDVESVDPVTLDGHRISIWLSHYDSLVQGAHRVQLLEKVAIPALLQTHDYATEIERATYKRYTDEQIQERVDFRLARQAVLYRGPNPLELVAVVDELVLLNQVGGPAVMIEQLEHLETMADLPNVELRILPADGRAICARGGFELLTKPDTEHPFMAVTFDLDGARYIEQPELMPIFLNMYEYLYEISLSPEESVERVREIAGRYREQL